jgi:protein-tyrosine sulfotransferase
MNRQENIDNPIFIVGTGRCGTTLMRLLLNSTQEVIIGPENDFIVSILNDIPEWVWKIARSDDLIKQRPAFYNRELKDYGFSRDFFLELIKNSKSRASFIKTFYEIYSRKNGYQRWGDNTPQNFQVADKLIKIFPKAKFLHLIRDCRDVALSYIKKDFGPNDVLSAAYLWCWRISYIDTLIKRFPDNFLTIRYEDFISRPEQYVDKISDFLNLPINSIDLNNYYKNLSGVYDNRVRSKIDKSYVNLWQKEMSSDDSEKMLKICGKFMNQFGYIDNYSKKDHLLHFPIVVRKYYWWFFVRRKVRTFAKLVPSIIGNY